MTWMSSTGSVLLVSVVLLFATVEPAAAGDLQPKIVSSRASGMVPFAVFLEATDSTDRNGRSINNAGLCVHEILEYAWDFGDGETFSGFNAAHVYEKPGIYTLTLTIRDAAGSASGTKHLVAEAFAGTTYYVRSDGNDSNDGKGPEAPHAWKTYKKAFNAIKGNSMVQSGDRVLFRRGDTFPYTSAVNLSGADNVHIGAYGQGERPLIQYAGTSGGGAAPNYTGQGLPTSAPFQPGSDSTYISIADIRVNCASAVNGKRAHVFNTNSRSPFESWLALRMEAREYQNSVFYSNGFFIVDSVFYDGSKQNMYHDGERLAILDCDIGLTRMEHNLYGAMVRRAVIAGTDWHDTNGAGVRIASNSSPGSMNVYMSGNTHMRIGGRPLDMRITNPRGPGNAKNILIEKSLINGAIVFHAEGYNNVVIRNNIFNIGADFEPGIWIKAGGDGDHDTAVKHFRFHNNTLFSRNKAPMISVSRSDVEDYEIYNNIFYCMSNASNAGAISFPPGAMGEIKCDNNLFYFPNKVSDNILSAGSRYSLVAWRAAFKKDHNSLVADPALASSSLAAPKDYMLRAESPAIDAGAALPLVYEDFDGRRRPVGKGHDIGAFEFSVDKTDKKAGAVLVE